MTATIVVGRPVLVVQKASVNTHPRRNTVVQLIIVKLYMVFAYFIKFGS